MRTQAPLPSGPQQASIDACVVAAVEEESGMCRPRQSFRPMFDLATIGAAVTSAKTIVDLLKNAQDGQLALKISSEVANIQSRLLAVQQQALDLQNDNLKLAEENRRLEQRLALKGSVVLDKGLNWLEKEGERTGPFCPGCWGDREKLIALQSGTNPGGWRCTVCKGQNS